MLALARAAHSALLAYAVTTTGTPAPCGPELDAEGVVQCALARDFDVQRARQELKALEGRRTAAGVLLPANPGVEVTVGRRRPWHGLTDTSGPETLDWEAVLSQEIEIAGQRGARVAVADAELAAQVRRVAVLEQETAARALSAYIDALAAKELLDLGALASKVATRLNDLATARAAEALTSPLEADLSASEAAQLGPTNLEAERRSAVARTELALLLGGASGSDLRVTGALDPTASAQEGDAATLLPRALELRGEAAAAEAERQALEHQLSELRRERVPNVTLLGYVRREGDEKIWGGGLSWALPLPSPLAPSRAGEIAETLARIDAAGLDVELQRARITAEVTQAVATLRSIERARTLTSKPLLDRARADLAALGDAMTSGQFSIREALVAQRSLIELLRSDLDLRRDHALAIIELTRAAGLPVLGALSAR